MHNKALTILILTALAAGSAQAVTIGFDNGETSDFVSYSQSVDATTWSSPGDWFGWGAYGNWPTPSGVPFTLADDSVANISGSGPFAADTLGIIDSTRAPDDEFFGLVDVENGDNPGGTATATWVFDIAGYHDLSVSADFAAMGDFESSDDLSFSYSIDGGPAQVFFQFIAEEALMQSYTMESGTIVDLNDPLSLNGTLLNDVLATFSAALAGTGSLLEIVFTATQNAGEGFVFDNLTVTGVAEPAVLVLFGTGLLGIGLMRRRRF